MDLMQRVNSTIAAKRNAMNRRVEFDFEIPCPPLKPPFPNGPCGGRIVTLEPELHYLQDKAGDFVLPPRNITVWLPPDYGKHEDMHFPVLYAHDGDNVMNDSDSWTGHSWRTAGALTRLSERKLLSKSKTTQSHSPPIIVMIPSAEGDLLPSIRRRHLEYGDMSSPFAQAHADFLALTLKPLIDEKFRTKPEAKYTSTIGSSLGAQASLHLLIRYPDLFGNTACLSPAFQPAILASIATMDVDNTSFRDKTIYIDNGGDVDDVKVPFVDLQDHLTENHFWNPGYFWLDSQLQPGVDAMKLALDARNIRHTYKKFPGGRHNERGWAQRIDKPLLCLYGDDDGDSDDDDVDI